MNMKEMMPEIELTMISEIKYNLSNDRNFSTNID